MRGRSIRWAGFGASPFALAIGWRRGPWGARARWESPGPLPVAGGRAVCGAGGVWDSAPLRCARLAVAEAERPPSDLGGLHAGLVQKAAESRSHVKKRYGC